MSFASVGMAFFSWCRGGVQHVQLARSCKREPDIAGGVNRDEVDSVERESKALCHANEIVKLAGAFFARAEFDRRPKS